MALANSITKGQDRHMREAGKIYWVEDIYGVNQPEPDRVSYLSHNEAVTGARPWQSGLRQGLSRERERSPLVLSIELITLASIPMIKTCFSHVHHIRGQNEHRLSNCWYCMSPEYCHSAVRRVSVDGLHECADSYM